MHLPLAQGGVALSHASALRGQWVPADDRFAHVRQSFWFRQQTRWARCESRTADADELPQWPL